MTSITIRSSVIGWSRAALVAGAILWACPFALGDEWRVCQDGSGDCTTIQACIDNAASGDTIIVCPGTYAELIDYGPNVLYIRSESGDWRDTTIDGERRGTVVQMGPGRSSLSGFTITGGAGWNGGGVAANREDHEDSAVLIENCYIFDNEAENRGGGLDCVSGNPVVVNCVFESNRQTSESGEWGGGGAYHVGGSPTYPNCMFKANRNAAHGPGPYGGGAMSLEGTINACIVACTFEDNECGDNAGAIYSEGSQSLLIADCLFVGNTCVDGSVMQAGGNSTVDFINCSLVDNNGCALRVGQDGTVVRVANSIIWGNAAACLSGVVIEYSDVEGGYAGEGNIDSDPVFEDRGGRNFRLAEGSPCIDAGSNGLLPSDCADMDGDGDTDEALPLDLDGNSRRSGDPPIVDMGAYEFQFPSAVDCDRIVGLNVRCFVRCRDGRRHVEATVRTSLPPGTELTLTLDGGNEIIARVRNNGKAKGKWVDVDTGVHEVCVVECPEWCETTNCCGG